MYQSQTAAQRYEPLPDNCIRLLSLLPSSDPTAQISCSLFAQPLTDFSPNGAQPRHEPHSYEYEALSYVWGIDPPAHTILVDGQPVLMRANLHDALKELRLPDRSRTLWVDSICIDQSDISERNAQVKMMGQIYASARQVVISLGRGDGDTDAAMDFIQGLERLDPATATRIANGSLLPWEDRQKVFRALGMVHGLDNYESIVGGLVKLMNHAWWKRMWTAQEIVLARSATLRCGRKSADWGHLGKLAAFALEVARYNTSLGFGRPMDEAIFDEMTAELAPLYAAVSGLNDLSEGVGSGRDITLEKMAWAQLLTRQATDPRDMIYALLGLVSPAKRMAMEIDYGKDKARVYASAMKAMILEYGQQSRMGPGPLHLLQDSNLERDPALPSWVPDFGILHSFKTTTLAASALGSALVLESEPLYNASLGDDADGSVPRFLEDDTVLEMEGVSVDRAEKLGDVCPRFPADWKSRQAQLQDFVDRWRKLLPQRASEKEYIGGGSPEEAFWRTVTLDSSLTDRDYFAGASDRADTRLPRGNPGMPPTTVHQEAEILAGVVDAPVPKTVLTKLGERRFFITRTSFFGLGPASMQVGDIVCILRGGFFPTAIRPATHGRYSLVGECFVHGIMDGEMIDAARKGMVSWQPFRFV